MRPFRRVGVVFNGAKSQRRLREYCQAARALLEPSGGQLTVYTSSGPNDLPCQARQALAAGCDLLVAGGGDGTLLGLLPAVWQSGAALTPLPLGTCNDYARALGIRDLDEALAALSRGAVRTVDLGLCSYVGLEGQPEQSPFCLSAGLGFSAAVARAEASRGLRVLKGALGRYALVLSSAGLMLRFRGGRAELTLDGQRLERSVALLEVSKVARLGGMALTPRARLDSGFLDVCLFDGPLARRSLLLLRSQGAGRQTTWPDYDYFCDQPAYNRLGLTRLTELEVRPERLMPVHLHGDFVGYGPARFTLRAAGLRVLAAAP
jgi:diacylglycerol kinase family enzyme